jgi:ATP-dependent DNA helicase RecG
MNENPKVTQLEMAQQIGISSQNVRKYIVKLKEKGWLLRIGPDKGGYWKVLKTPKP